MSDDILAIVQARSSSSRFPRKVLQDLQGKPMVLRQLERIGRSKRIGRVVVATSEETTDDELVKVLTDNGVVVRRGPLDDVWSRFAQVLDEFSPNSVVRLTADCPLTDPAVIDDLIALHIDSGADYTSNVIQRTFPHGLDAECIKANILQRLGTIGLTDEEREHVTLAIYSRPKNFTISSLTQTPASSHLRWTVDYPSDLEFVRSVYACLYERNPAFDQNDILNFLKDNPQLVHTSSDV